MINTPVTEIPICSSLHPAHSEHLAGIALINYSTTIGIATSNTHEIGGVPYQ
jgi:hypothetical protein